MIPARPHPTRGSVVLTALCLIAVLGIALATYLSISRQSLQLSDRSFRANATVQLAELGIERALAAFNSNDWSGWTLSGTTATRAYTGISSGAGGVTGTVNVRVTNYDTFTRGSTWSSTAIYQTYDLVNYNGTWYRCLTPHTSRTPTNLNYWVPEGVAWEWSPHTTYRVEEMVYRNGFWYRCTSAHTNQAPPNGSYWYQIPANAVYTETNYTSTTGCILNYYGTWYTWTGSSWSTTVPTSWRWRTGYAYSFNDVVCYSNVWYRCILAHSSQTPTNTTYWRPVSQPWTWSSSATYYAGDIVYNGSNWYRCLVKHANQSPTNTTYWATTPPVASFDWNANAYYANNTTDKINHVVKRGGIWYRCLASNSGQDPTTPSSSYWSAATSTTWSATNGYAIGDYVAFGGIWYRCRAPHTNQQPGLETYWQAIGDFVTTPVIVSEGLTASGNTADNRTQLRATVGRAPLFPNAIAASSIVSLNNSSAAGLVDSYDSTLGTYASQTPGYAAIIAGGNTSATAISVSGGTYKGYFAAPASSTSPYAPLISYGGSVALTGSNTTGMDLSRISRNPYIPDFGIHTVAGGTALPTSSGWPTGGIAIGTPGGITPTVYTYSGALDLNATNEILTIRGPVILNIVGELRVRSSGRIILTSTGSAEIHFDSRLRIETTGAIVNQTLDPKKLTLLSDMTSGSGSNTITTSTALYGTIYLPSATNALTFDTNSPGFYGAVSAKNVTFNAYANLHYDTSLRTAATSGVDAPFQALSLRQLTGPTDADWVTF